MKKSILMFVSTAALALGGGTARTFTGVITETMCGTKHNMGITDKAKCIRECVKSDPTKYKYALQTGEKLYVLSDQRTPEQFAGARVNVTGTLFEKTGIIRTDKIERAK
jgi:hypothetical protein